MEDNKKEYTVYLGAEASKVVTIEAHNEEEARDTALNYFRITTFASNDFDLGDTYVNSIKDNEGNSWFQAYDNSLEKE